ncbi:MAG TPA: phage holin family protein [Actinomycetota bacterium]|nr:phage holin family protein [Actinomycetota bacterium]
MNGNSTKSSTQLIVDALDDFLKLIRKELELLKTGLVESLTDRLKGAGLIAAAALVVLPGLLFVLLAVALWLPGSAAMGLFLIGVVLLAVAGAAILWGLKLVRKGGKDSNEALDRVKEDARWARDRVKR